MFYFAMLQAIFAPYTCASIEFQAPQRVICHTTEIVRCYAEYTVYRDGHVHFTQPECEYPQ